MLARCPWLVLFIASSSLGADRFVSLSGNHVPPFATWTDAATNIQAAIDEAIAGEVGCTPAQLALAWLLHQGDDILPIPGTTSVEHLKDDLGAADVRLSPEVLARLDALINPDTVFGDRYSDQANREVDTEVFGRA